MEADLDQRQKSAPSPRHNHRWLVPGQPPEFSGNNAAVRQQYLHAVQMWLPY